MNKIKFLSVGDVCSTVSETYKGKADRVTLINTSDVLEGQVLNHDRVPNVNLRGQFKKTFQQDDILYSEIRPKNKRFAYIDFCPTDYIASTKLMVLRANRTKVLPKYLYYFLKNDVTIAELQMLAETRSGTFPQITFTELANLSIPVPPIADQETIIDILECIDNKIGCNRDINDNLEQQAQLYFQNLFVENADPEWTKGTISDLGTVVGGSTPSKSKPEYYTSDGIAWITPKDLSINKAKFVSHGENDITELGLKNSSASVMPEGTVLFSSRAPIGYITIASGEVTTNQGFKSVVPKPEIGTAYVYYFLKHNLPVIEGMASGSTFKEVSGNTMKNVPAVIPDTETLACFNGFCAPIFAQQRILEKQNQSLVALRDGLLPKLMSGEIDVSDIQL